MITGRPITPEEVEEAQRDPAMIPPEIFTAFNELMLEKMGPKGKSATISDQAVLARVSNLGLDTSEAGEKRWFDIEDFYRQYGWTVTRESRGYHGELVLFTFIKPEAVEQP